MCVCVCDSVLTAYGGTKICWQLANIGTFRGLKLGFKVRIGFEMRVVGDKREHVDNKGPHKDGRVFVCKCGILMILVSSSD